MDDKRIIALFFVRSESAITEVQKKYGDVCLKLAHNILKNDLDAQECVNDTFLAIWNTIPPQNPDSLISYIMRITRNISIKYYHRNTALKRNSIYDSALAELENCLSDPETVEGIYSAKELSLHIDNFLDTLSKENRVIFVRRYYFSDSVSDISKMFHASPRMITLRLYRMRQNLKKYLDKKGVSI